LAVTVLTSFEVGDLASIGVGSPLDDQIVLLAHLARNAGAEGLVCSPAEARRLRTGGFDLTLFTPGVRPRGAPADVSAEPPRRRRHSRRCGLPRHRTTHHLADDGGALQIVASINHSD
jgi:orotidine-5'-phosphate decarboxylase